MNFYNFNFKDIQGRQYDSSLLSGKKILLVNTASECGLTPQFEQLEEIYRMYGKDKFEILGFPSNDFAGQDPGSNDQIAAFCQKNYGVSFPMMEKITVLGEDAHPLYKWLTSETGTDVKWNFHKFLIDEKGAVVKSVDPRTLPTDEEVVNWIEESTI